MTHISHISFRAAFLIVAASVIFHVSTEATAFLLVGYISFAYLDQWLLQRQIEKDRDNVCEEETSGWEQDPEHPEYEDRGNFSRIKLARNEQIIVTRIAELLRRMP